MPDPRENDAAERQRGETELVYRAIFDAIDEGICRSEVIFDPRGHAVDFIVLDANAAYETHSGLVVADVIGKRLSERAPNIAPEWLDLYASVARTGKPGRMEYYVPGQEKWLSVYAQRVEGLGSPQLVIVLNDITVRKRADLALRGREEHQSFVLTLSDSLRAETGVDAVGHRAVRMIADRLGLDRVYLVTLSPGDDNIVVTHEARREDMPPLRGSYRGSDFPAAIKQIFTQSIVYDDVRTDPRLTDLDRQSFVGLSAVGFAAVPIR